ncbi:polymer-forming cytoskeletal protein [Thermomonas sp.]|uniref:bactofilin family protein n=1 Tax=Thermomonas sp. TaxID=1971895 RepID=UPI002399E566|nr:polymer-forming cytoskeletal protein [Pseudomonadota bacterium]MDE2382879.1 polymer-forming cytoskeletal protein [Xanthomonadaceae bacterium]
MAIWKDPTPAPKAAEPVRFEPPAPTPMPAEPVVSQTAPIRTADAAARESVIASDLIIEGKIEGSGHVRIAGKFKGDIKVQGNLSIDQGAKVSGGVSANKVTLAGELDGNIASAKQVELLSSGAINGDLKAGSLTVAAGSRIRGHVECGWGDVKPAAKMESGGAA